MNKKSILDCPIGDVMQVIHHLNPNLVLKEFKLVSVTKLSRIEYEVKVTFLGNPASHTYFWCRDDGTGVGSKSYLKF